jgi:hypothetical protein
MAAAGLQPLPTRQVVIVGGPHPPVELATIAATLARDRWGHIGATSGPRMIGSQRTTRVTSGPASCQFTSHIRPDSAGRHLRQGSLTRKRS